MGQRGREMQLQIEHSQKVTFLCRLTIFLFMLISPFCTLASVFPLAISHRQTQSSEE